LNKTYYTVGSFAKLTSTTIRTLHFYDRKGLLKPSGYNQQGHRTYADEDFFRLHQILTLKYLDYSLDEIGEYLEQDGKDFKASLEMQYELLLQKQQHIQRVVAAIERAKTIIKDKDTIDPELIMQMIRSIQLEEEQKQWLSDRQQDALVQSMSAVGPSLESEILIVFDDLLRLSKQGLPPEDSLVQERMLALKLLFEQMFGQPLQELGTSEAGKVLEELDPQLFPNFEPSFTNFLSEAFSHLFRRLWEEEMGK